MDACQDIGEPIGEDFPTHFGVGRTRNALNGFIAILWHRVLCDRRGICATPYEHTGVVVDAKEINGCGDNRKIIFLDGWRSHSHVAEKILRVASAHYWIEEPAIAEGIGSFDCEQSFWAIISGVDWIEVERNTDLCRWREMCTQARHSESMCQQDMMPDTGCQLFVL